jgi:hypothetical protein
VLKSNSGKLERNSCTSLRKSNGKLSRNLSLVMAKSCKDIAAGYLKEIAES